MPPNKPLHPDKMESLAALLRQGWKSLYPPNKETLEKIREMVAQRWNQERGQTGHAGSDNRTTEVSQADLKPISNFKEAADQFLRDYQAKHPRKRVPQYILCKLRLHLLPYFGSKDISEVTNSSFEEYCGFRRKTAFDRKTGKPKPPSKVTLRVEVQLIRRVIKTAQHHSGMSLKTT